MTKETLNQIITLKEKHTTQEVSKLLGLSYSTTRYWLRQLKKNGYPIITHQKRGRKPLLAKVN